MASTSLKTAFILIPLMNVWGLHVLLQQFQLAAAVSCITLANLALFLTYRLWIYPRYVSPIRHMPGPTGGHILTGHLVKLYSIQPLGEVIRRWMEEIPNDGLLRFRDVGGKDGMMITSPAMLKAALSDDWTNFRRDPMLNALLAKFVGTGLITSSNDEHSYQRKRMQPAFQNSVVRKMRPMFWEKALELADALKEETSKHEVNFSDWCSRVTLDIIGTAGFGQDFGSLKKPDLPFRTDFNEFREPTRATKICWFFSLIIGPDFIFPLPFKGSRRLTQIAGTMYRYAADLIKDRHAEFEKSSNDEHGERNDVLSFLMKNSDFNDGELSYQVRTLLMSGQITTASTLGWCAYLLAQYPEWQPKLREEIRNCLSNRGNSKEQEEATVADIDNLPLLNAVLSEVLRLYPVATTILRRTVRDSTIGGWRVPANTRTLISPWAINRSTKIWGPDATIFRPERWLNESGKFNKAGGATSNYANMTFSHGPRNCIGQEFVRSELKFILAAIVERYFIEATRDESTYYPAGVVAAMSPAHGVWLRFSEVQ